MTKLSGCLCRPRCTGAAARGRSRPVRRTWWTERMRRLRNGIARQPPRHAPSRRGRTSIWAWVAPSTRSGSSRSCKSSSPWSALAPTSAASAGSWESAISVDQQRRGAAIGRIEQRDDVLAAQLAAEQGADPRAGEPHRVAGGGVERQHQGIGQGAGNGGRRHQRPLRGVGRRPSAGPIPANSCRSIGCFMMQAPSRPAVPRGTGRAHVLGNGARSAAPGGATDQRKFGGRRLWRSDSVSGGHRHDGNLMAWRLSSGCHRPGGLFRRLRRPAVRAMAWRRDGGQAPLAAGTAPAGPLHRPGRMRVATASIRE